MSLREAYDYVLRRRTIADPRKDRRTLDVACSEEFLDQLGIFECQLTGRSQPSLTGAEIFESRHLLNLDDPLPLGMERSGLWPGNSLYESRFT